MSVSTVTTYLSGLSYAHKIRNLTDYTKSFIISKMLEGLRRKNPQKSDIRTPISLELLKPELPGACNRSLGSKLLSITTQLHCGGHHGGRA